MRQGRVVGAHWPGGAFFDLISLTGDVVGVVTLLLRACVCLVRNVPYVEGALKGILVLGIFLVTSAVIALSKCCLPESFSTGEGHDEVERRYYARLAALGL